MLCLKDRRLSEPRLGSICALVFHHTAVFLLLTHHCGGQSVEVGQSQPIVATVGDDIILPCHLEPAVDTTGQTVEWSRPDLNPRFVYVWRNGVELQTKKHPSYVGRTSLSINKLKYGDISLKLSKVKLSDEGRYRCYVPTLNWASSVELVIGATSSLIISLMRTENDEGISGVVLQCVSKGWYPEPEVFWLDSEGNLLSAGPTETVRGPDGLYTVSSRVTVEKRHSNRFTCRVQQKNINQNRETHIYVPDDFFNVPCSCVAPVAIASAAVFMVILVVVFVAWKWRRKQNSNTITTTCNDTELQPLNEEKTETLQDLAESTRIEDLDKKKANLNAQLKKTVNEHNDVIELLNFLKANKKDVEDQMHQLILERNGVENCSQGTKTNLDTGNKELQKKLQDKDTILKLLHCGVTIVTERKNMLDNLKEQINKQLEEDEKQRNEIQKKLKADHLET